jgi:hypothetical protein
MNVFPLLALADSELAEFEDVDSVLRLSRVRTLSDMGPLLARRPMSLRMSCRISVALRQLGP